MKQIEALYIISQTASSQWGLVTSAQALEAGVDRTALSRLEGSGFLVRLRRGVFRLQAVPAAKEDSVRAAWLAVNPKQPVDRRLAEAVDDFVVAGATAAYLYGYGDMDPEPYCFATSKRKQISSKDIRILRRKLNPCDVSMRAGLPVLRLEKVVYELLRDREDTSLVVDFVRDAVDSDALIDRGLLVDILAYRSRELGFENGEGLVNYLMGK